MDVIELPYPLSYGKAVEIVVSRAAETKVIDDKNGVILSSSIVPYGSTLFIKEGIVKKGDVVCEWDAYNAVIVSEIDGKIQFNDITELGHIH